MTDTNDRKFATFRIIEHLQNSGPQARVLLIVGTNGINNDAYIGGPEGFLTKYRNEFSATDPMSQLTHVLGGTVRVELARRVVLDRVAGQFFSLTVIERVNNVYLTDVRETAAIVTRLGSNAEVLEAENGVIVE